MMRKFLAIIFLAAVTAGLALGGLWFWNGGSLSGWPEIFRSERSRTEEEQLSRVLELYQEDLVEQSQGFAGNHNEREIDELLLQIVRMKEDGERR
jgi:hypothetical protein